MKKKIFLAAAVFFLAFLLLELQGPWFFSFLKTLMEWVARQGAAGPVLFVLIYVLATLFFCPLLIFTLSGGFLFGKLTGTLAVSAATLLSAVLSFFAARYGPREFFLKRIEKVPGFKRADQVISSAGWKMIALTRLSTLFPFTAMNFAYGLSEVRVRDYVLATWIGMMPGNYIFAALGASAENWVVLRQRAHLSPQDGPLFFISVLLSAAAVLYMIRLFKKTEP